MFLAPDQDWRDDLARHAVASMLAATLVGVVTAGVMAASLRPSEVPVAIPDLPLAPPVESLALVDLAPPEAPAPPLRGVPDRAPGGGSPVAVPSSDEPDTTPDSPEEAVDDPALPPVDETLLDKLAAASGSAEGPGEGGGDPKGVQGGDPDGRIGGTGRGAGPMVHHAELTLRRRIDPVYPLAARGMGLGEPSCVATVRLDAGGVPVDLRVEGCPEVFHHAVIDALSRWRWAPPRMEGAPVGVQTRVRVVFRDR